jgi:hypothetical protein
MTYYLHQFCRRILKDHSCKFCEFCGNPSGCLDKMLFKAILDKDGRQMVETLAQKIHEAFIFFVFARVV